MTTTNPTKPLDRIRSLAPAVMTDDELGVACEEIRWGVLRVDWPRDSNLVPEMQIGSIKSIGEWRAARVQGDFVEWDNRSPNPALDLNALFETVRKWVGRSPKRLKILLQTHIETFTDEYNPEGIGELIEADTHDLLDITDTTVWCLLHATPRQLAEAFVTAAREVG